MKIALFHNLPSGGAKRHTYEQVKELVKRGHVIHEFTQSTAGVEYFPLTGLVVETTVQRVDWRTLKFIRVPGAAPFIHLLQNYWNIKHLRRKSEELAKVIDDGGYDLVFTKDCRFLTAPLIMKYLKTPCVFYMHSFMPSLGRDEKSKTSKSYTKKASGLITSLHNKYINQISLDNIRYASNVLTNSFFSREACLLFSNIESQVIYPGIDTAIFRPASKSGEGYLLSVGSISKQKGHEFIIESISRIEKARRPRLMIASIQKDEPLTPHIQEFAKTMEVSTQIEHAQTSAEMAGLYSNSLMGVFAPHLEPLGLAVLEAQACGVPVIGVKEGGLRETIQHGVTGFLVERDPALFSMAIQKLIDDEELRIRMGAQARAMIEAYWTWPRAVDELESRLLQFKKR